MINKPAFYFIFLSLLSFLLIGCSSKNTQKPHSKADTLYANFVNPPNDSSPGVYWCWLNGDVTRESLTSDLEAMKSKGINRAEIWDVAAVHNPNNMLGKAGGTFLGDSSVALIRYAMKEGKRLQMQIGLVASSGWNAGGSWVTPDWASKALYFSQTIVESNNKEQAIAVNFPKVSAECPLAANGKPIWYKEAGIVAVPFNAEKNITSVNQIIDLSQYFNNDKLTWEVPQGKWAILRFICSNTGQHLIVPTPNSNGLFIDFLDPEATKKHLGHILNRLNITEPDSGLHYLEYDSMELASETPWTDNFSTIFFQQNSYDILPYQTMLAGWNIENSTKDFMHDFKKTVSNQLIKSHYTTGRDFLKKYDIDLVAEAGGPGPPVWNSCPVEALKALGNVSIPRGEFWIKHRNIFLVKEVASAAHTYGQKYVDAESFTTWRRWKDAPHELKSYVDRAFCEGLNRITFHTFANTRPEHGLPGRTYHAGVDFNPATTWWNYSKPFVEYLTRCSYMLSEGTFVADVLYYYGDDAPNFFPAYHDAPQKPSLDGLSKGYDFDIVNTEILTEKITVKNGKLSLPHGQEYQVLVIPTNVRVSQSVKAKLQQLQQDGAAIVIQHPDIKEVNGATVFRESIDTVLNKMNISQDVTGNFEVFDFIHRKIENKEVYFIRNKTNNSINETIAFRVENGNPQIWDAVTAKKYSVSGTKHNGKQTEFKLQLPAYGSCFVVFDGEFSEELPVYTISPAQKTITLNKDWQLTFPKGWGAPEKVTVDQLKSWTVFIDEGIKYFSGTATYQKEFSIDKNNLKNQTVTIDLGTVYDVAEVTVNKQSAGVLWTAPYQLDITKLVKSGNNTITVKITNMWINRLTGDMLLPPEKRFCKTNHPYVTENVTPQGDEVYKTQPSGLLGPVVIGFHKE